MNVIAMETGKSKLIESLKQGNTLIVTTEGDAPFVSISDVSIIKVEDLIYGVDGKLISHINKEGYDTVIFYTQDNYSRNYYSCKNTEYNLETNSIFMFGSLD